MMLHVQLRDRLSGESLGEWSGAFIDGGAVCTIGTSRTSDIALPRGSFPELPGRAFRVLALAERATVRFEHMGLSGNCTVDGAGTDALDLAPGTHDVDVAGVALAMSIAIR